MNTERVLNQIKDLIVLNKDLLVTDLIHQGEQRELKVITTSSLTPPTAYYAVLITSSASFESDIVMGAQVGINVRANKKRTAFYNIEISIGDEAVGDFQDDELFETADKDFQKLLNRIAELILNADKDGELRLGNDREIRQLNAVEDWLHADEYHAMLFGQLQFTVEDFCQDNQLY